MDYSIASLAFIAFAFIFAGMVKGIIGLGLPTVAIGILTLRVGMPEAVAMLVLPTVITNFWQLFSGPRFLHLVKRFRSLLISIFIGAFIGVRLLINGEFATLMLGLVLVGYGLLGLSRYEFKVAPRWEPRLSPVTGLVTGVLYGSTGLGVTAIPYVTALQLPKDELIQAMGLIFSVMSVATALALAVAGRYEPSIAGTSAVALVPAMLGMALGQWMRAKMDPLTFRRWFFVAIVVLGIYTSVHGLK